MSNIGKITFYDNGGGGASRYTAYSDSSKKVGYGRDKADAKADLISKILSGRSIYTR